MTATSLADRLNKLFDVMHRATESAVTNAAVAEAVSRQSDTVVSPIEIQQLRDGTLPAPAIEKLGAIAAFFGVPANYLTDPSVDAAMDAQLTLLRSLRDSGIRDLHLCAGPLSPQATTELAEHIARLD